jgi:hypothetical protein
MSDTLCPQEYQGVVMRIVPCTRCSNWKNNRCRVPIGAEPLPRVPAAEIPYCPLADRCQHAQRSSGPCSVRQRGLVCVSALATLMPYEQAMDDVRAFHADLVATPEDLKTEA